jgi:hypothetical protein
MTQSDSHAMLLEMLKQLRDDFAQERDARRDENEVARQGRAATHGRIDEVIDKLARLDTTVALAGQVDAQVRTELDALKKIVAANHAAVAPSVDEWKRIRRLGLGIVGLMTAGGLTVGAMVQWGGDLIVERVRAFLHIVQ